jgi:hypothetical protein
MTARKLKGILCICLISAAVGLKAQTAKSRTYFKRAKFLMTSVDYGSVKAGKDYVGALIIINTADRPLKIREITQDCGCFNFEYSKGPVLKDDRTMVSVTLRNAPKGVFKHRAFIFFEGEKKPVLIPIKGRFN